jgi:hypothetical protein
MALSDFFRINLPYGIRKNKDGKWFAFNMLYSPIGINIKNSSSFKNSACLNESIFKEIPFKNKYRGLSDEQILNLKQIMPTIKICKDQKGKIVTVFFFEEKNNPQNHNDYWNKYFEIIKFFSKFEATNQ